MLEKIFLWIVIIVMIGNCYILGKIILDNLLGKH
jgi:hypothetical protein